MLSKLNVLRVGIFFLFLLAIQSTAAFALNIDARELPAHLKNYWISEYGSEKESDDHTGKKMKDYNKRLPNETQEAGQAQAQETDPGFESTGETVNVTATGYTAGYESTGKSENDPAYGITRSGVEVRRDYVSTVAADPDQFPIGTLLYIPDYGYGVVADTGSAITGNKLDLYYDTVDEVYKEWGKKEVDVHVLKRGNGSLSEKEVFDLNEEKALPVNQLGPSS